MNAELPNILAAIPVGAPQLAPIREHWPQAAFDCIPPLGPGTTLTANLDSLPQLRSLQLGSAIYTQLHGLPLKNGKPIQLRVTLSPRHGTP